MRGLEDHREGAGAANKCRFVTYRERQKIQIDSGPIQTSQQRQRMEDSDMSLALAGQSTVRRAKVWHLAERGLI